LTASRCEFGPKNLHQFRHARGLRPCKIASLAEIGGEMKELDPQSTIDSIVKPDQLPIPASNGCKGLDSRPLRTPGVGLVEKNRALRD
jgi:hypothetical protein